MRSDAGITPKSLILLLSLLVTKSNPDQRSGQERQAGIELRQSTKSQMEIMGLAVVIVLLTLAILFTIQFVYLKPESSVKTSYESSQLAANTITAILQTTTSCNSHPVRRLLSDCASNPPSSLSYGGTISCGTPAPIGTPTPMSCSYVQNVIGQMLDLTLGDWHRNYNLTVLFPDNSELFSFSNGDCSGEIESNTHPLQTNVETIFVKLDICS